MAIHVMRFNHQGSIGWGVVRGGRITPVPGDHPTTNAFVTGNAIESLRILQGESLDMRDVEILSPVTQNQQFICQGANYRQHMIESGMDPDAKKFNMIFRKASSCISPANSPLIKPSHVQFLDYEIELGLILKKDVTQKTAVTDANLGDFVAGLVIVNDYSARDVQIPQMQFYKGKSYRTFGPVGPYLCLLEAADISEIKRLELVLTVNGIVRQKDSTANLVFGPAETLTELSGVQDLYAGDLIATGTPAGCALTVPSPFRQKLAALVPEATKWKIFFDLQAKRTQYLKAGDIVEARISGASGKIDLGKQRNVVVEEGR